MIHTAIRMKITFTEQSGLFNIKLQFLMVIQRQGKMAQLSPMQFVLPLFTAAKDR